MYIFSAVDKIKKDELVREMECTNSIEERLRKLIEFNQTHNWLC